MRKLFGEILACMLAVAMIVTSLPMAVFADELLIAGESIEVESAVEEVDLNSIEEVTSVEENLTEDTDYPEVCGNETEDNEFLDLGENFETDDENLEEKFEEESELEEEIEEDAEEKFELMSSDDSYEYLKITQTKVTGFVWNKLPLSGVVEIPEGITEIGEYAFGDTDDMDSIAKAYNDVIKSVILPKSLKIIGNAVSADILLVFRMLNLFS